MKICSCPPEIPFGDTDYSNFDMAKEAKREQEHKEKLKVWIIAKGYDGPYSGAIYREQIADGYAEYMLADRGPDSFLMHLPYGDAYHSRNVEFLPKKEIIRRIEAEKKLSELFAKSS